MGAQIVRSLTKGKKLGRQRRRPSLSGSPSCDGAQEGFARDGDKDRQAEAGLEVRKLAQHLKGSVRFRTQKKAHAGIEDQPVSWDARLRERFKARVKKGE